MTSVWSSEEARKILPTVVAAKLVTLFVFGLFALVYPAHFDHARYIAIFRGNHGTAPTVMPEASIVFATYDAEHYLRLAESGYDGHGPENAFYPLYPMLVGGFARLTGAGFLITAIVLSTLFGIAATLIVHDLARRRWGNAVADTTVALLLLQPAAFFSVLPYTESLFLLLLALLFACLSRERLVLAGIAGFALALTRPVGIFAIVPIAMHAWSVRTSPRAWLSALLPLLGWASYFAILHLQTGDASLGFRIQRQFIAAPSMARLLDPAAFVHRFVDVRQVHGLLYSALDRVVFVVVVVGLVRRMRRRDDADSTVLASLLGIVPAVTTAFMSFTRYASVVFPVHESFALGLSTPERRWLRHALYVLLAAAQLWLISRHAAFVWAG